MNSPMPNQTEIFLQKEADAWFERNFSEHSKQGKEKDLALQFLNQQDLSGKHILEVGCADGWRLADLLASHDISATGVEPSEMAIEKGKQRFDGIDFLRGTASDIHVPDQSVDIVVSGFCLYLCDRDELFKIAYEYDRILKDEGLIVITDFVSSFPYKNPYSHQQGLYSYKMDYASMFTWNPYYTLMLNQIVDMGSIAIDANNPDNRIVLSVLRKQKHQAYPSEPYSK